SSVLRGCHTSIESACVAWDLTKVKIYVRPIRAWQVREGPSKREIFSRSSRPARNNLSAALQNAALLHGILSHADIGHVIGAGVGTLVGNAQRGVAEGLVGFQLANFLRMLNGLLMPTELLQHDGER